MSMITEDSDGRWNGWETAARVDYRNTTQFKYALNQAVKRQTAIDKGKASLLQLYVWLAYPKDGIMIDPKHHSPCFLVDFLRNAGCLPEHDNILNLLKHYNAEDFRITEVKKKDIKPPGNVGFWMTNHDM